MILIGIFAISEDIKIRQFIHKSIVTEPLTRGNYTIAYKSELDMSWNMEPNFAQDIKYTIIAK